MIFYRPSEDWITHLEGDALADLLKTLRGLSLERLHKYPPPKVAGLPLGNESREFLYFLTVALPESTTPDNSDVDLLPFHRTYIGLDSLRQIEIMGRRIITGGKRYLPPLSG